MTGPYAEAAQIYRDAGWLGVLPVDLGGPGVPPDNFTGRNGGWPDDEQIAKWVTDEGHRNVGLRLPDDVLVIDVDAYDGKRGAATIETFIDRLGSLPPTWYSTSRGPTSESRKWFFRVPAGRSWFSDLGNGSGVEVIHLTHRWVRVWPGVNHRTGQVERWYLPDGAEPDRPPRPDELTDLPDAWVAALQRGAGVVGSPVITAAEHDDYDWRDLLTPGAVPNGSQEDALRWAAWQLALEHARDARALDTLTLVVENFTDHRPGEPWDGARRDPRWADAAVAKWTAAKVKRSATQPDLSFAADFIEATARWRPLQVLETGIEGRGDTSQAVVTRAQQLLVERRARELVAEWEMADDDDRPTRLVSMSELRAVEQPGWLVEGLVPRIGPGLVFGSRSVGKSLLVLDLALSVGNNLPAWHGWEVNHAGATVLVLREGEWGFHSRVDAWLAAHPGTTDEGLFVLREQEPFNLGVRASVERLARDVEAAKIEPALLFVDTLGQATLGHNENDATAMNVVFRNVKELAHRLSCFVAPVHHTGWDDSRERGSSSMGQAVDVSLRVEAGRFVVDKLREGARGAERFFELAENAGSVWARPLDVGGAAAQQAHAHYTRRREITDAIRNQPGIAKSKLHTLLGGNKPAFETMIVGLLHEGVIENRGPDRGRSALFVVEKDDGPASI